MPEGGSTSPEFTKTSIEGFKTAIRKADFNEIISLPAFGEITKFELAWFVLYHTQRHLHQLKKILISLTTDKKSKKAVSKTKNFR